MRRLNLLQANPIMLKELRGRMRGTRAFVVITVYLMLMSGFALLLYVLYSASLNDGSGSLQGGQIGRTLFTGIVGLELFLVMFIVPAFTAGAITGERERQTYDLLRTTLLSPRALVIGKLLSALFYTLLLLLAAIPLQSLGFLFGGVSIEELILAFVILLVTAITLGTIGLYFSATLQRTQAASIATYGFALLIVVGLPLIMIVILSVLAPLFLALSGTNLSAPLRLVLTYGFGLLVSINPLATAYLSQYLLIDQHQAGYFTQVVSTGSTTLTLPLVSPWIAFSVIYLGVSAALTLAAIRRVGRIEDAPA